MRFSFEESDRTEWQHKESAQPRPHRRTTEPPFTPWTLQQSLFAVCGGIAVDTSSFWDAAQVTLTPRGLLVLARAGLLPQVADEEITEKSKANTAAKILVCIQAGWFLVQAVARLAQKLPLTLLEVHVLAHVLCALAMYFCWVDKPYDVEMPVVVRDERVKDLVSLFVLDAGGSKAVLDRLVRPIPMSEIRNRHRPRKWVRDPSVKAPRFRFKMDWPSDIDDGADGESDEVSDDEQAVEVEREPPTPQELARMQEHHKRVNRGLDYLRNRYLQAVACRGDGEMPPEPQLYFERTSSSAKWKYIVNERSNRKIEGAFAKKDKEFGRFDKAFSIISAIYGTLHLSAWNEHFPSTAECWMWRVGALCMVVAPSLYQAHSFVEPLLDRARVPPRDEWVRATWLFWIAKVARLMLVMFVELPLIVIGFVATAGWGYGRLFMLVESFVSLRSPPVDTYRIPEWSSYFPHAG
ncbi:uncharacterized protein J3D65DRAFT_139880 [Phyllosticta citribraziliensis]|uniref:Uncharacterized protein n=1 Tax=Phyllosticta citribraziliensis TaxID=989973 RepID=A0ABR1L898_9PEZI